MQPLVISKDYTRKYEKACKKHLCTHCGQYFSSEIVFRKHQKYCHGHTDVPQFTELPEKGKNNKLCFKKWKHMMRYPCVIYLDFESYNKKCPEVLEIFESAEENEESSTVLETFENAEENTNVEEESADDEIEESHIFFEDTEDVGNEYGEEFANVEDEDVPGKTGQTL
ncbi:10906_t:CDS:2 [Entrophospora sp. SA101]|nr:10906_t:CDS:2 [Entrophospora sp. SA101]